MNEKSDSIDIVLERPLGLLRGLQLHSKSKWTIWSQKWIFLHLQFLQDLMFATSAIDLGFSGNPFTWAKGKWGSVAIKRRLGLKTWASLCWSLFSYANPSVCLKRNPITNQFCAFSFLKKKKKKKLCIFPKKKKILGIKVGNAR